MVSLKKKFEFLDDGIDIPFYNDVPKLSALDWMIVLASIILMICVITVIPIPGDYLPIAVFLIGTVPALYICKGNYGLFFKKLRLKDFGLVILCVIGMYVYSIVISMILTAFLGMAPHTSAGEQVTLMTALGMLIQLMGEEFFKILLLLLIMYVIYKLTSNRGMALSIGLIASMVIFGIVHYNAYSGRILQIILIQGFGSIFEYYAFLKTKNVWVGYLIHIIRDFIPVILNLLHILPTA